MHKKMEIVFGLLQIKYQSEIKHIHGTELVPDKDGKLVEQDVVLPDAIPGTCGDSKCGRTIRDEEDCFIDTWKGTTYCEQCGKCIRYERSMADRRGEDPTKVDVLGD